ENAEQLFESTSRLYGLLYDGEQSVHDQLALVRDELRDLVRIDARFEDTLQEIDSARIITAEAAKFLQGYQADIEFNPERLEEIRIRLGELERLKRKYGGTLESVLEHRRAIGEAYDVVQDVEGALKRLDDRIAEAQQRLSTLAHELSDRRKEAAARVEKAVEQECTKLGMPDGRFEIRFRTHEDPDGWIHLNGRRFSASETGHEAVEFYISTNLGEETRPLARIASGGENSRIMLALKTILARHEKFPILVFDEIDVGISGAVASKVAESMHELASSHQIIAITHLPQIAARGDVHFLVEKYVDGGRTKTRIRRLSEERRAILSRCASLPHIVLLHLLLFTTADCTAWPTIHPAVPSMTDITFGTDGWRAVIADQFTFRNLDTVSRATVRWIHRHHGREGRAIVGYDTRFMGDQFAEYVARVLASQDIEVILADSFAPTPAISWATKAFGCQVGVVIT